jgi:MFS family permease
MGNLFQKKLGINSKTAVINVILVANALVWYLCIFSFIKNAAGNKGFVDTDLLILVGVNLLVLVLAAIFSSKLIERFENRLKFLVYWVVAGVFLSIIPLVVEGSGFIELLVLFGLVGGYFGLGLPVFMGYYSASTETENRARTSGIIIFLMGVFFVLLSVISAQDPTSTTIVLAVWRTFGLVSLIFLNPPDLKLNKNEKTTYKGLVKSYSILFYFVPWLMFTLINNLAFPIMGSLQLAYSLQLSSMVETVLAGISAIFFGFLADYVGRKRLLLIGFVLIGLGYAALGVFSGDPIAQLFYMCVDGIAFGAFTTLFLLTIWGDLADKRDGEKYYIIGFIPYLLSTFIQVSIGKYLAESIFGDGKDGTLFSFFSFFLFAAVLPLYLAPETLPEKAMKDRNLKSYLEKAQKIAEKELSKNRDNDDEPEDKQEETKTQEAPQEQEKSQEYDEAKKLAEQYY